MELHRYEEAVPVFETALMADAKERTAPRNRSGPFEALGRTKESLEVCVRLTTSDAKDPEAGARRARLANAVGEGREALAAITKATSLAPDRADLVRFRRDVLALQGSFKAAAEAGERLLELDGRDTDALREMAVALERLGRSEGAIEALDRAARVDPMDRATWDAERAPPLRFTPTAGGARAFRPTME